jgi:predicted acetyltransferase
MSQPTLRPVTAEEFPAYYRTIAETFNSDPRDAERELEWAVIELDRTLAAFVDKEMAATGCIYTRTMTVPGALLPIAGVSMISVASTHRRQGLLTAIIRRQLTELHEQEREPVAVLWASESIIYQRFGYGMASQGATLTAPTRDLAFRAGVDLGAGRVRLAAAEEARPHLMAVFEEVRPQQVGCLDRGGRWWDNRVADPEFVRTGGATTLRFALYEEPDGHVSGYAFYRLKPGWEGHNPNGEVELKEIQATTPQAYAALWSFLTQLDLVRKINSWQGRPDEPLLWLLADPRQAQLRLSDQLWLRLADVGRALAARRYAAEVDVVFEVADAFCPWNAGRWRLSGGPAGAVCEPTTDAADLELTSTELGAAYLGGPTLSALAAAGRVREVRPGALARASAAFRGERAPWCPEVF